MDATGNGQEPSRSRAVLGLTASIVLVWFGSGWIGAMFMFIVSGFHGAGWGDWAMVLPGVPVLALGSWVGWSGRSGNRRRAWGAAGVFAIGIGAAAALASSVVMSSLLRSSFSREGPSAWNGETFVLVPGLLTIAAGIAMLRRAAALGRRAAQGPPEA